MKHQIKKVKFAHSKSQRVAILRNLAKDLVTHGKVKTTKTRAKAVVPYVEKMITYAKKSKTPESYIFSKVNDKNIVERIKELSKRQLDKVNSGYFSIFKTGNRKGDGAEMCVVVMNGYEPKVKSDLKKVKKTTPKKAETKKETATKAKKETK